MTRLFGLHAPITLYSAESYPISNDELVLKGLQGRRNGEMRAITIAAFRVAQNNTQLSQQKMNLRLMEFLLAGSPSAVRHWLRSGRLSRGAQTYQLTPQGLAECQNTLLGLSGRYRTTEELVRQWVVRMLGGDRAAPRARTFGPDAWNVG